MMRMTNSKTIGGIKTKRSNRRGRRRKTKGSKSEGRR